MALQRQAVSRAPFFLSDLQISYEEGTAADWHSVHSEEETEAGRG